MPPLIIGAGAVGLCVAGWMHHDACILARGEAADRLEAKGLRYSVQGQSADTRPVTVLRSLEGIETPEIVLMAVKSYQLEAAIRQVQEAFGDEPVVMGLQNGLSAQELLPEAFSKVAYGIVSWNTWIEEPSVVVAQSEDALVVGGPEAEAAITALAGLHIQPTDRIRDAAYCKMLLNLTNSLTTLLGLGVREIVDRETFRGLVVGLLGDGLDVLQAAGVREVPIGRLPRWWLLRLNQMAPGWLARPIFERRIRRMVLSSLAQDVLVKGRSTTELEDINGALLSLADAHGVEAPTLRGVTRLAREGFAGGGFEPMSAGELRGLIGG